MLSLDIRPLLFCWSQWAALRAGNYYFNVYRTAFPGGELRGQLFRQLPAPEQLNLLQQLRP